MLVSLFFFGGGLAALGLGADRFVLSAARLSRSFGLSPVLIGALVVGLGTSAPELLVSGLAAARGEVEIAVGNVVGSNTANLTLVLGSTALLAPVISRVKTIRREGAVMLVAMAGMSFALWNRHIDRLEAGILLGAMALVVLLMVGWSRRDPVADLDTGAGSGRVAREFAVGVVALAATLAGADVMVRGAVRIADELGISSAFVGLVIVAVGTSLPELATAVAAARRGETDLVLGNVVGSNLFNSLAVMGTAGLIGPGTIGDEFRLAMAISLGAAVLAGVFVLSGKRLNRIEGGLLLGVFAVFVPLVL
jgi:cation:H+ antiporter